MWLHVSKDAQSGFLSQYRGLAFIQKLSNQRAQVAVVQMNTNTKENKLSLLQSVDWFHIIMQKLHTISTEFVCSILFPC